MKLKNVVTTKQEKLLSEKVSFDEEGCGLFSVTTLYLFIG